MPVDGSYWWVSCNKFTVRVACDNNDMIVEAAPIVGKFIGQPLENLLRWCNKLGGLQLQPLPAPRPKPIFIVDFTYDQ